MPVRDENPLARPLTKGSPGNSEDEGDVEGDETKAGDLERVPTVGFV